MRTLSPYFCSLDIVDVREAPLGERGQRGGAGGGAAEVPVRQLRERGRLRVAAGPTHGCVTRFFKTTNQRSPKKIRKKIAHLLFIHV